ncbi:sugar kinase [Sphingomonas daechungensis]|uniref:Sugar kinase n=1 Tax=Sphingomonas daechungensis TaxID=1176646 RepID=A0ABX6T322_9SPHN|nr:sugar kinase [Sphingomonas daechungensis]QNP44276.1 sugar kinase [Sphingomonas daechungensis]
MKLDRPGPILCFGEVMLRLSTAPGVRLANAQSLAVHAGGSEANAGALLAQLGRQVEMITVLPASPLGDQCEASLRSVGLDTRHVRRSDGRMGLYFVEGTAGAGRIVYDRAVSAFAENADASDWPALARDASWFHMSGINLALGGKPAEAALDAARAMVDAGVPISFDVNHRASLWEDRSEADVRRVNDLLGLTDVLFTNPRHIAGLADEDAIAGAFAAFPKIAVIAWTERSVEHGRLSANVTTRDESFETDAASLANVIDRIGSGDAFAGAVIDAILRGAAAEECVKVGLAAAVMKHGIAGDRWIGTREDLEAFDPFAPEDVRR